MTEKRSVDIHIHPHTVVFSLYAQHVLPRGGNIWIGSLIQALGALGYNPGAVRTLVSRMKKRGYLQSRRCGRCSFYRLTGRGQQEVCWGGDRTFASQADEWDGRWTVVIYSVPEEHRERRDALRYWLTCWGFGALAPGTWICPRRLSPEAAGKWQELDVQAYLEVFRAKHLGPSEPDSLVAQAWPQLPALEERYRAYVAEGNTILDCLEAGTFKDEDCFVWQLQSLVEFVAITLEDPSLPPCLLPEDWPRPAAQRLFEELEQALAKPAERFFDAIYRTIGERDEEKARQ